MLQGPALRQPTLLRERLLHRIDSGSHAPYPRCPAGSRSKSRTTTATSPPFDTTRFQFLLDDTGPLQSCRLPNSLQAASAADWSALAPMLRGPVLVIRCEGEGAALAKLCEEFTAHVPGCRSEWLHTTGIIRT